MYAVYRSTLTLTMKPFWDQEGVYAMYTVYDMSPTYTGVLTMVNIPLRKKSFN